VSPEREWTFRIRHIIEAIEKIARYTHGMTYQQFAADERTVDAVIRNFLVIGEATRHVPTDVRETTMQVPWRLMEGMRHVLVHDYDSVKLDTIWKTIIEDLPPLIEPLRRLGASQT
jgi:uncharacterized protein with HEPN domain